MKPRFSTGRHLPRVIVAFLAAYLLVPTWALADDRHHRRHDGREFRRGDFERVERAREYRERAYVAGAIDQHRRERDRDYYDRNDDRHRYYRDGYDDRYRDRYRHHDNDDDDDDRIEGALIGAAVGAIATGIIMNNTDSTD